jgi:hypothetical protein
MTPHEILTLAMPLVAVAIVALTGFGVVYQATHRAARRAKPERPLPDDLQTAIASGRFPVVLLSKRDFDAYSAFVKDRPHAAE